ncbi:MAG: hypothetical protein WBE76_18600 [Terracidiphilus sp.]
MITATLGLWLLKQKPEPLKGRTFRKDTFAGYVHLSVTQYSAAEKELTGTATADLGATSESGEKAAQEYQGLDRIWLQIEDIRPPGRSGGTIIVGGTDAPMEIRGLDIRGSSSFRWQVKPVRASAFYPFDSYVAAMHPVLLWQRVKGSGVWDYIPVDTVDADFSAANFTAKYYAGPEDANWFTLELTRPLWLRVVAVLAVGLLVVWAVRLPFSPKAIDPAELLALFVGVFGLRSSLLSGAPVFPSLVDYLSILIYTYVVAMLLLRRFYVVQPPVCRYCKSDLHCGATVCAACTRPVVS